MNTCKTCTYWAIIGLDTDIQLRLRTCRAPEIKFGYGVEDDEVSDNGAVVEDDEGWGIRTGPDFGCVLHEERSVKA